MFKHILALIEFVLDAFVQISKKLFWLAVLTFLIVAFTITSIVIILDRVVS